MRTRTILIGALLLASAGLAQAQAQQQPQSGTPTAAPTTATAQQVATPASSFIPKYGTVDFGYRFDDVSGDFARYNRFKDTRDGGFIENFRFNRETVSTLFRAEANNVGYRDQRYFGEFRSIGRVKASFEWDQIPLFSGDEFTKSWYTGSNGVLTIDDSIQAGLQAAAAISATARDQAIANAMGLQTAYDLKSRRDVGRFDMVYMVNRDIDLKVVVNNTNRNGNNLIAFGFGTSPGLLPAIEVPVTVDDRTTDVKAALEYANGKGLLAVGYEGSWYNQNVPFVRFDNPMRVTDISGGPSAGQMANWPTNSSFSVNVNGSYKLPARSRVSAALSFGQWSQDETLPPPTVNTALVAPPLERSSAQTQADIVSMLYTFNSRPIKSLWLSARYRYYDYSNETPVFTATNAVIGDWNVGTQVHVTEPSSFQRQNIDLDASFAPLQYLALGVGYGREDADRTFRIFENTVDDTFRVTVDSTGNQYFTLRWKYEFSSRTGSGFEEHLLEEVGEQPETRHYDIANRDRSRVSTLFSVTPVSYLSLNAAVGYGNDEYDDTGFGLRDAKNRNWSAGFDVTPLDKVSFGLAYVFEKFTANQYSRTASPAPDPTFTDPRRDWWIDSEDRVQTVTASVDLTKVFPKTDIRVGYDWNNGEATYVYNLKPEQTVFTATPLRQLVPVKNRLTNGTFDLRYFVRSNLALGVTYEYEEYKVEDFSLGTDTINRLDARNGTTGAFASTFYTGYLFRPYTAHTVWTKMTYLW